MSRRPARLAVIVLASLLGASTITACGSDVHRVRGPNGGALSTGEGNAAVYPTLKIGRTWAQSDWFTNGSDHAVTIEHAGPTALPSKLELVTVKLWLVPPHVRFFLPGTGPWPVKDPRVREARPPEGFIVPPHRTVQMITVVKTLHRGLARVEGAKVRFNDRGRSYDWTFTDPYIYPIEVPQPPAESVPVQ